jgi:uncharacterized membrane protein
VGKIAKTKVIGWFLKGLIAILPIAATLYIIYWLGSLAEAFLGGVIKSIVRPELYLPGTGLFGGLIIITLTGYIIQLWLFRNIYNLLDKLLKKIPGVSTIYVSILSMTTFLDSSKKKGFSRVVLVQFQGMMVFGLITREDLHGLLPDELAKDKVMVYIPASLQVAGGLVILPKGELIPTDIPVETVMKLNFTAGTAI